MNKVTETPLLEELDVADQITGISVIVPAYNEETVIGSVLTQLTDVLDEEGLRYEIIVVDDGSRDQTASVVSQFDVTLIKHARNKGYGAALKSGIRKAKHDFILTFDSDGQHNPTDVPHLVEMAKSHAMVVGARVKQSYVPGSRRMGKWLLGAVANFLAGTKIPDLNSGFRVFRRDVALRFMHILPDGFSFTTTITLAVIKEGLDIIWLPTTTIKRVGTSTVKPIRDGYNTLLLIMRTIVLFDPLKVFLPPCISLGLLGIGFSVYGIMRFRAFPETGILLLLTSILLFFFGILADQISALRRGLGQ